MLEVQNVLQACNEDGQKEALVKINKQLEQTGHDLRQYTRAKCMQFPLLFLLSQEDLLKLLSCGSNPRLAVHFVPQILVETASVLLTEVESATPKDEDLSGSDDDAAEAPPPPRPLGSSFSGWHGEVISFWQPVSLEGPVELYLQKIMDTQRETLQRSMDRSVLWNLKGI